MFSRLSGLAAVVLASACFATSASAYTPESGIWWNPSESGTGVVIEVQDDLMVVAAYVGDAQGKATWYTATAFLSGNALFEGQLDLTEGSQCIGCAYTALPLVKPGDGGRVRIVFDPLDETKASLTWTPRVLTPTAQVRTIPIERFEFYTRRPEDANAPVDITKMLGEWQWVLDLSETNAAFPFYGDVTVLDQFDFDAVNNGWFYEGCRADNSLDGGCSPNALAMHNASGFYIPSTDVQCIVVLDGEDNAGDVQFLLYAVKAGTNQARGEVTLYPDDRDPRDYFQHPARGWRSASRTFVQEGTGPARAADVAEQKGLGSVLTLSERTDKAVEYGDYTESCMLDPTARKRAEDKLLAARKN